MGHLEVVDGLLQRAADPNAAADHFARTPLCLAAHYGHFELVHTPYGRIYPDGRKRTDRNGRDALHYAIIISGEKSGVESY